MHTITTQGEARQYVIDAIEASGFVRAAEFDVDAIVDALYAMIGGWNFTRVDEDTFWLVVSENEA